jgi:membrane protease subunit HflK
VARPLLVLSAVAAAALYLATGVTQVQPGERAVVRRFGAVVAVAGPGLHLGWPWPIDRVDRVPVGLVRQVSVGFIAEDDPSAAVPRGQVLTGDQNLVDVQVAVDYTVAGGDEAVIDFALSADRADAAVARLAEAAVAEWAAGRGVDEVILGGKAALPGWLVPRLRERLAGYRLGVEVRGASVTHLLPPGEVRPAFDRVAQAQAAARTAETDARRRAERTLNDAAIDRDRQAKAASAGADERRRLAQADAAAFLARLAQYRRLSADNARVRAAIWWDEVGRLLARMREAGRVDLLDNHIGADGLDVTQFGPRPKKR